MDGPLEGNILPEKQFFSLPFDLILLEGTFYLKLCFFSLPFDLTLLEGNILPEKLFL
jgi:hypothetical protein